MTRLHPRIKEQWLAALRGNEYKQGTGVLHDITNQQFCCLGVLCDIARKEGVIDDPMVEDQKYVPTDRPVGSGQGMPTRSVARYGNRFSNHNEELPQSVAEWAFGDQFETNPAVMRGSEEYDEDGDWMGSEDTLAELNDGGVTFTEIADLIEEHL